VRVFDHRHHGILVALGDHDRHACRLERSEDILLLALHHERRRCDRGHCRPVLGVLLAEEQRACAAHRMAHQVDAVGVDVELGPDDLQHRHHVELAQLGEVRARGRLVADLDHRRAVPAADVVAHRADDDVPALLCEIDQLAAHDEVGIAAEAVQCATIMRAGRARFDLGGDVQRVLHLLPGRREGVSSLLYARVGIDPHRPARRAVERRAAVGPLAGAGCARLG
jgi:hypothetical protein